MSETETKTTSPLLIAAAWLIVGIPAAWGVYNTALNAKKLFVASPPAPAASQTSAPSKK
jgi:hypothetical protein